jgi:hypothetical protein
MYPLHLDARANDLVFRCERWARLFSPVKIRPPVDPKLSVPLGPMIFAMR